MLPNVDFAGGMEIFVGILDGLTSSVFGLLEFPSFRRPLKETPGLE